MPLNPASVSALPTDQGVQATFEAFLDVAHADPSVLGLVVSGSQAKEGMATVHSDFDVFVIVADDAPQDLLDAQCSTRNLDLSVMSLDFFRRHALPGGIDSWNAYAFLRSQVVLDRTDGLITALVADKGEANGRDVAGRAGELLDAYTNSAYRSLKDHRDGRESAARLDAVESIAFLLTVLFALHGRVRPYNKYLQWELERYPLGGDCWSADAFLPRVQRIIDTADPETQRAVFADIERIARAQGHGQVLDDWGPELAFIQGTHTR